MPDAWGNPTSADYAQQSYLGPGMDLANAQAQNAYYNALANGQTASNALAQAKFEWDKQIQTAGQTGQWGGQWNNPQQQWFTSNFGQWFGAGGEPGAGSYTLPAQAQAQAQSALYGQYYAPGTNPAAGTQTLAAQNQANQLGLSQAGLTGWYNAPGAGTPQQTLAGQGQQWNQAFQQQQFGAQQQQLQQQNAQNYLQLLSSLRGPADWAKYQQVLGSTPGGIRDLAAAAMGQYTPGGGATTGVQPQAVDLNTMQQQIQGGGQQSQYYPSYQGYGQPQMPAPNYWQPPAQQQPAAQPVASYPTSADNVARGLTQLSPDGQSYAYSGTGAQIGGNGWANPQGSAAANASLAAGNNQTWGSGIGVGQQANTPQQQIQATGNGTNMYGGQQQQYNLPAPNQIAAQSWNNFAPSQKQLLLGQYEAQGYDKNDVQALYNQSLPRYGSNNATAGTWRLR